MSDSIMLFIVSGICFVVAMIMFVFAFLYGRQNHGINFENLHVLKSEMMIHTEERIGYHSQTMRMSGE